MPRTIRVPRAHLVLFEGRLIGEASTLGLRPGEWPEVIEVESEDGVDVYSGRQAFTVFGELAHVTYRSGTRVLQIIND